MFSFANTSGRHHRFPDALALSRDLAAGPSPDKQGLESLRRRGFRSIVNLNAEGIGDAPLSPNVEATWAHAEALEHARMTLYAFPRPSDVDALIELCETMPKPIYVHSHDGTSALALAWIAAASSDGAVEVDAAAISKLDGTWRQFALAEIARRRSLTTRTG